MKAARPDTGRFVVATPGRSVCDQNARALEHAGHLRFIAFGTRRGTAGVPPERTRLNPMIGLCAYATARLFSPFRAESLRFRLLPWFDRWVRKQIRPGDHIISSYGYANACFAYVRAQGGKTFVDAGNSHIENYWETISEEHRRWQSPTPPFSPFWLDRSRRTLEMTDFVLSPSTYVTDSFLSRGFAPHQILTNVYPVDLSVFTPRDSPRPEGQPLTIINTGSLSLRKGTPYLLEAFRLVRREYPTARLLLTRFVQDDFKHLLPRYSDLPIEWSPGLPHGALALRLQSADIFVLPSLEEGLARTSLEALACGLPIIVTPNTGSNDFVEVGVNGEVVSIRDARALADAILAWAPRLIGRQGAPQRLIDSSRLTFQEFERSFLDQLASRDLI